MRLGLGWLNLCIDLLRFAVLGLRSRTALAAENLFLRKQLGFLPGTQRQATASRRFFGNGEYYQPSGYDKTIGNGGLTQPQVALTYTAFDGGRRIAQLLSSRYAAQATALGVKAVQAQVVFDTSIAYFDLLRQSETQAELATS